MCLCAGDIAVVDCLDKYCPFGYTLFYAIKSVFAANKEPFNLHPKKLKRFWFYNRKISTF